MSVYERNLAGAEGRPALAPQVAHAGYFVDRLEGQLIHAALARHPLTRRAMFLAIGAVLLAAVLVARGAGRARHARLPTGARAWASVLLLAALAAPVWLYVEGILGTTGVLSASLVVGAAALGTGLLLRIRFGATGALIRISMLAALIPLVDLLLGTPLAYRSPLAFQIAGGGRFYGVDEGVLGVVLGAHLIAAGLLLDRARLHRAAVVALLVSFAAAAWIVGAPGFGAKFGAPLTVVPAFGVMLVKLSGRRIGVGAVVLVAVATIAVTGAMVGVDRLRSEQEQTHVARVTEGRADMGALIERKVTSQIRITLTTVWSRAALVFGGALLFLRLRRRDALDRGMWGRPGLRAAVFATLVGAGTAFVFNDGGVIASAPILLFGAGAVLLTLLEPAAP